MEARAENCSANYEPEASRMHDYLEVPSTSLNRYVRACPLRHATLAVAGGCTQGLYEDLFHKRHRRGGKSNSAGQRRSERGRMLALVSNYLVLRTRLG